MIQAVERLVAMRYLRARRQEGFISVIAWFSLLGIALGVATLIIVMAVMNGFRAELLGRILGLNGHISVAAPAGQSITDPDALVQRIRGLAGVVAASPMIEGQVMATANGVSSGALVRGMRSADLHARHTIASAVKLGRIDGMGDDGLLIGLRMAQRMGLTVGDQITLISPRGNPTPFGTVPRLVSFRVAAIFEVGMFEYDNTYVYMPFQAAQTFFRVPEGATNIEVLLSNADQAPFLSDAIWMLDPRNIRVLDWQRTNASFFNALQVERNVMFLILTLIILVAAFNIISSMIMLVKDKGRDIAILRTMGASRGTVMRIFFLAGFSVGAIGTLAGLCLGVAFATNIESIRQWLEGLTGTNLFAAEIYFLSKLPARLDWNEVIQVVLMALGLSVLATLYPSWRAARLDPVEALRYE